MRRKAELIDMKRAVVRGDGALDWHIAAERNVEVPSRLHFERWTGETSACITPKMGGVFLLTRLIRDAGIECDVPSPPNAWASHLPDKTLTHTHSLWVPKKKDTKCESKEKTWRMIATFGHIEAEEDSATWLLPPKQRPTRGSILVIQDLGFGIRRNTRLWGRWLKQNSQSIDRVIYHLALPSAASLINDALVRHVINILGRKVLITTSRDDLRRARVKLGQTISVETSAEDVRDALNRNPRLAFLKKAGVVIVSSPAIGAVLADFRNPNLPRYSLIFVPHDRERDFFSRHPGRVRGYAVCMTAALTVAAAEDGDFVRAAIRGLRSMRKLQELGGGPIFERNVASPKPRVQAPDFPFRDVTTTLKEAKEEPFSIASVPRSGKWSLLGDMLDSGDLEKNLFEIVTRGTEATCLEKVPILKLGEKLSVINRHEIESYLSLENMISEYLDRGNETRPLCLAAFGPPGCGKSTGIKELAGRLLLGGRDHLEYNLSQFADPSALIGAFHQIRDRALTSVPLVLWDEFDSTLGEQKLGWLKYFLAPMQDGKFQEGRLTHHIGRSIFVFCGGTSSSLEEFRVKAKKQKMAKAPDFISRIRGFVNVKGLDGNRNERPTAWKARRALILHSLLKQHANHILDDSSGDLKARIDDAIIRAFMGVRNFRNGVRSMESIILLSALQGKPEYVRSSLPPQEQLDLHVMAEKFNRLIRG